MAKDSSLAFLYPKIGQKQALFGPLLPYTLSLKIENPPEKGNSK